ncbi:hypothetical protein PMAYCL1PPCAC_22106 [Pristionchus mayeri]|uniref:Uncharacterized protein n=1 Tax=Pristionchus mayeri TaxID=1317129 RepID=A0AAN5CWD2_9BILA|nr:hypothetical protein PMAYCL1PPCAC_22106 [Pristionchus mayeri]
MTEPSQRLLLSWTDPYYPMIYQDEHTGKLKGSSIEVFKLLQFFLKNISFEYVHFDINYGGNFSMEDPEGFLYAIRTGSVLTELSGANLDQTYPRTFGLSPAIGTSSLSFYEADISHDVWSPISYFIPFDPFTFILIVACILIVDCLDSRGRRSSLLTSTLLAISSAIFIFGMTFLLFAYNAGC